MKQNRSALIIFLLLIVIAALYRIVPDRPLGFAPQIAMAFFGGAVIRNRKLAFLVPILSMFIADSIFEIIYRTGGSVLPGFYEGQFTNYLLFAGLTVFGFLFRQLRPGKTITGIIAAPVLYFLFSNFFVWMEGAGLSRPKTWEGLLMCYTDGLPFLRGSMAAMLVFSVLLFGGYFLFTRRYRENGMELS